MGGRINAGAALLFDAGNGPAAGTEATEMKGVRLRRLNLSSAAAILFVIFPDICPEHEKIAGVRIIYPQGSMRKNGYFNAAETVQPDDIRFVSKPLCPPDDPLPLFKHSSIR